jgi:transposase
MFSYLSSEARVRKDRPLRAVRAMVDEVLIQLSRRFDRMYAKVGRPSIALEKLLRAQLLQMLYSIRSERLLMGRDGLQPAVPLVRGAERGR